MLGFAEGGQVGVEGGDIGIFMAEVDLDLAEVFALFQEVGGVTVAQGVDMGVFFDATGAERQAEGALEGGALNRLGGGGRTLTVVALAGKEERGMAMRFPELAQQQKGALGQRDVTVASALAGADVEEAAFGIHVADLEAQGFAQAQAAGIEGGQGDAMIQGGNGGQDAADLGGREDDGKFELGIGADQLEFVGPDALEGFLPEELEGADDLGGSLAGDFLCGLEMDAVLAELLGRNQVGRFGVELTELAEAGKVGLFGAGADGQELEVVGEGI